MFLSHNPADGSELCRREAESWQSFLQKLHCLRIEQQSFSTLPVTARTALLSDFAARLEANQDKLARMMCEEVGRCLRECRAELNNSSATTPVSPPNCWHIKPLPLRQASAKSASNRWAWFWL